MIELKAYQTNIRSWLLGITGMSAHITDRVYFGMPQSPPGYPCIVHRMRSTPNGDYPHHAWDVRTRLEIAAATKSEIDEIQDLIYQDLATAGEGSAETVEEKLSDADVLVADVHLEEIGEDEEVFNPETGSYIVSIRAMVLVAKVIGQ